MTVNGLIRNITKWWLDLKLIRNYRMALIMTKYKLLIQNVNMRLSRKIFRNTLRNSCNIFHILDTLILRYNIVEYCFYNYFTKKKCIFRADFSGVSLNTDTFFV